MNDFKLVLEAIGFFSLFIMVLFLTLSFCGHIFETYVAPWLVKNIEQGLQLRLDKLERENSELRKQLEAK